MTGFALQYFVRGRTGPPSVSISSPTNNAVILGGSLSIAGNIYDLLKDVAAVSQEAQWNYNFFYAPYVCAPYVLIPEMNVAGKS
jgi:hypothetical protein